jgi:2-haloacid dehalogenase
VRDSARAAQIAAALNARLGFAVLLRDGFALAAADGNEPFAKLAEGALRVVLADFAGLGVHRDVPEGVRILRRHGLRLVTLTNGSADVADGLLTRAGLRGEFQGPLSVEDAAAWKPVPVAYAHAARACSVSTEQMLLVAVRPWDIHAAHQAGMRTGWIARQPTPYPGYFAAPDLQAQNLAALAEQVVS